MRKTLKQTRKTKGLKQIDIARKLDITDRHYQHIEAGTRGTSEENWLKLYHLFNEKVPLHKLMENNTEELFKLGRENSPSEKN